MNKFLLALCTAATLAAQVTSLPDRKLWYLNTKDSSYVIGVNERNELQTLYWGGRLF